MAPFGLTLVLHPFYAARRSWPPEWPRHPWGVVPAGLGWGVISKRPPPQACHSPVTLSGSLRERRGPIKRGDSESRLGWQRRCRDLPVRLRAVPPGAGPSGRAVILEQDQARGWRV